MLAAPPNPHPDEDNIYVAAMQRLVVLAYQLRREQVATANVPAFMSEHPEWATHPVNNVPFGWDSKTSQMSVPTQLGDGVTARRWFDLILPPVSAPR